MKVELVIHAVAGSAADGDRSMLLLKEKDGSRILPIMMSTRRAVTVMMRSRVPMPMPVATSVPDASLLLLRKFGIEIKRMELTSIKDAVFICKLVGEQDGVEKQLDFLPANDGIVLATMAPCPILIEDELLEAQYLHKTGENTFAININTLTREMLEDALKHAVESENYEAASQLRDELAKRTKEEDEATQ